MDNKDGIFARSMFALDGLRKRTVSLVQFALLLLLLVMVFFILLMFASNLFRLSLLANTSANRRRLFRPAVAWLYLRGLGRLAYALLHRVRATSVHWPKPC